MDGQYVFSHVFANKKTIPVFRPKKGGGSPKRLVTRGAQSTSPVACASSKQASPTERCLLARALARGALTASRAPALRRAEGTTAAVRIPPVLHRSSKLASMPALSAICCLPRPRRVARPRRRRRPPARRAGRGLLRARPRLGHRRALVRSSSLCSPPHRLPPQTRPPCAPTSPSSARSRPQR